MKTIVAVTFAIASFIFLATTTALVAQADEPKAATKDRTLTGTVKAVDAKERTVTVKRYLFLKSFHLGDHCTVSIGEKKDASIGDLRPGQKIQVTYQDAAGVLVASQGKQLPMTYAGRVEQIETKKHSLTVRDGKTLKSFALADDCKFALTGGKEGKLEALQPGDKVTVWYESSADGALARRIEQESETFTGSLTAVDAQTRTVKLSISSAAKLFNLLATAGL
jgi:Cu/Ag efflux protein CusF